MAAFLDNVRFSPTAGGTTDWTFSGSVTGYQTPAAAGVVNGTKYKYFAISSDQTQWEIGEGVYNTSTNVLTRATVLYNVSGTGTASGQTGAGTKINFSTAPQVAIIGVKEDLLAFDELNSFTSPQQEMARTNLLAQRINVFNGTVVESHASNAVTFAVKTLQGNDPSATAPVIFAFPNNTGGVSYVSQTSALSITVPSGATLGTSNGVPFRVYIGAFNDSGTVRMTVRVCSASTAWVRPMENLGANSTLTPGNNAHVFYTTGAAVSNQMWMWLAFASYEAGLTTAGTWNVSPTNIVLMDKSTPRVGESLAGYNPSGGTLALTDSGVVHNIASFSVAAQSACNLIELGAEGYIYLRTGVAGAEGAFGMTAAGSILTNMTAYSGSSSDIMYPVHTRTVYRPNSTSSISYGAGAKNIAISAGEIDYSAANFIIKEIMG